MALNFDTLTPGQKKAVLTLDKPLFIAAGAGSGKTFTLTQRIVWALSEGSGENGGAYLDSLDQALVITFTNEAAKEIKERVREALEKEGLADEALKVDSAWISTIHSMCARILRAHAFDIGIDPDFVVLSDHRRSELLKAALEEVLTSLKDDDAYAEFFSAFELKDTAYAGKSKVHSLDDMIEQLAVAALSAPNGFDSIELAIEKEGAVPDLYHELEGIHDGLVELLSDTSNGVDEKEVAKIAKQEHTISAYLFEHSPHSSKAAELVELLEVVPNARLWKSAKELAKDVQSECKKLQAICKLYDTNRHAPQLVKVTQAVVERFSAKKQEVGGLDNDDLLNKTARAFEDYPELEKEYSDMFKLVMIDEFQDTNDQQVRMIKRLSGREGRFLTTVGDAQQSIYGFRDADVEVFFNWQKEIPEERRPLLTDNFRSHDDILRFVRTVCDAPGMIPGCMDLHADKNPDTFVPLQGVPRVLIELTAIEKRGNKKAAKADVYHAVAAQQLADRISQIIAEGTFKAKDIVILMRSLAHANLYMDALRQRGIESVLSGGTGFGKLPEVQSIASLLMALADIHDTEQGLFPVLTSGMFSLEASDFILLATNWGSEDGSLSKRGIESGLLSQEFQDDLQPSKRLERALEVLLQAREDIKSKHPADVLLQVVRASGWITRLERGGAQERSQAANILAAIRRVRELNEELQVGLTELAKEFSQWLEVTKIAPSVLNDEHQDAVKIQTIHASKGKEYKVVAVVGALSDLNDKAPSRKRCLVGRLGEKRIVALKPSGVSAKPFDVPKEASECRTLSDWRFYFDRIQDDAAQAEAVRLLYVALTRAQEMVILTATLTQQRENGYTPKFAKASLSTILKTEAMPYVGRSFFEYGGSQPGALRTVYLRFEEDLSTYRVDDAGEGIAWQPFKTNDQDIPDFDLYTYDRDLFAPEQEQRYEKFYSYSSLHRQLMDTNQGESLHGQRSDEEETMSATAFGSAFHELAQYMVETDSYPQQQIIENFARRHQLKKSVLERLKPALERWNNSAIRAEALSHTLVRSEVPFCLERPYGDKRYLRGAIDLLATDPKSTHALVVDYKTGDKSLSPAEIIAAHRMQANVYAYVLMQRGYTKVECAFVCVEVQDALDESQPFVAHYAFDQQTPPTLAAQEGDAREVCAGNT